MKNKLKFIVLTILSLFTTTTVFGQYAANYQGTFDCESYSDAPSIEKKIDSKNETTKLKLNLISVFPNPSEDFVFLKIKSSKSETVQLNIIDAIGRVESNMNLKLNSGLNVKKN